MTVDVNEKWGQLVKAATAFLKEHDFDAARTKLLEALETIDTSEGQSPSWKSSHNGYACDEFLNQFVVQFYKADHKLYLNYADLAILIGTKAVFDDGHQSQFTLTRLFDIATELSHEPSTKDESMLLFELAYLQQAKAFSTQEALRKIEICQQIAQADFADEFYDKLRSLVGV